MDMNFVSLPPVATSQQIEWKATYRLAGSDIEMAFDDIEVSQVADLAPKERP